MSRVGEAIRSFGLLVVGQAVAVCGGLVTIYAIFWFYLAMPGGAGSGATLRPLRGTLVFLATDGVVRALAVVALVGFLWDVKRNGVWPTDDRLLAERLDEKRKDLAEEREAWSHPELGDDPDLYDDLSERAADGASGRDGRDIRIVEHEPRFGSRNPCVEGLARNVSDRAYEGVKLELDFHAADGSKIGYGTATKRLLEPGDVWRFQVVYLGPHEEALDSYEVAAVGSG